MFGQARLDDPDALLLEFPDCLQVLLERRVKAIGHHPIMARRPTWMAHPVVRLVVLEHRMVGLTPGGIRLALAPVQGAPQRWQQGLPSRWRALGLHQSKLGLRRVLWVRIVIGDEGSVCDVGGIAHRRPVVRRIPLSTATALVASGVPAVVRRARSPSSAPTTEDEGAVTGVARRA